ncbi:hypothetical protein POTOM_037049 [Populus tomentosa]|uniref:Uncharacterized protein n=1 Tax=Populus tomentosa TaxID=118781 RepID=A0A8X7Z0T3_POPTO|nr:hypothetical protein POTOM_037049 [Populus tomentosa]
MLLTPQAKLLVSILSSTNLVIPHEAYPLLLRTLYIWVRKSLRPSSVLIDSAVVSLSHLLAIEFGSKKSPEFLSESVLLLGAFSFVLSVSESSKTVCLELLCRLLEDEYRLVSPFIPDVLAGIGYALCSSVVVHNVGILNALLGIWGKEAGPTAGVLRASNRSPPSGQGLLIISILSVSAENRILALARNGSVSSRPSLLISLDSALLTEIFPLEHVYARILEPTHDQLDLEAGKIKER